MINGRTWLRLEFSSCVFDVHGGAKTTEAQAAMASLDEKTLMLGFNADVSVRARVIEAIVAATNGC